MGVGAWFYVALTAAAVCFALFVRNEGYVPARLSGRRPLCQERQRGRNLAAELGVYGLLAGVSACRVGIGADYWVYWLNFQLIAQGRHVSYEFGFRWIVRLMQFLFGDGTYRTIFFLFSVVTVFLFLKALHDQADWYAASLYLLLAGGYYFSSMHSVRYYFALAAAMFSAKYVIRGEYEKFLAAVLLTATIHKSVLVVIPAYLLARWLAARRFRPVHYLGAGVFGGILVLGQGIWKRLVREIIFFFYPYYEGSAFDVGGISWPNVGKCLGVLVLGAICWWTTCKAPAGEKAAPGPAGNIPRGVKGDTAQNPGGKELSGQEDLRGLANRFYFYLNLMGLLLYLCGSFIPEVSRIGYYLIVFQIFLIPNLLARMKRGVLKTLCIAGSLGAFAVYFAVYLYRAYDASIHLLPYLEWIFH